jgi:hypothetical protein
VFRYVAVGRYTRGRRAGERCVCKWFKPELQAFNRYAEKFFTEDVKMVDKALRILREWNMRGLSNGVTLQMIRPEVWEFEPGARGSWAGRKVLQEPFIESFVKCWSTPSLVPPPRLLRRNVRPHLTRNGSLLLRPPVPHREFKHRLGRRL